MKVLLAVDGSDYTKRTLEYVVSQDEWLGPKAQTTVLTVVPELPPRARAYMNADDVRSYNVEQAEAVLAPIRAFAQQHQWQPTVVYEVGEPGAVIAGKAAREGFDLVVMGSRGHSSFASLLLGSVTVQVLARCSVPLLVLRRDNP
jgi:nucleotide-binding universal stress UspA family protein